MKKDALYLTAIVILIIVLFRQCEATKTVENLHIANEAKLELYKNKDGTQTAKIRTLETKSHKDFIKFKSQDSTIQRLQEILKDRKKDIGEHGSITIVKGTTKVDTVYVTNVEYIDSLPVYKGKFNLGGWVIGTTVAKYDETSISLSVKNSIEIVLGDEKTGFLGLGPTIPFAEVTNLNPYSEITDLRTYRGKPQPARRLGVGPVVAYGIGSGFTPQVFVGVGVTYSLIRF